MCPVVLGLRPRAVMLFCTAVFLLHRLEAMPSSTLVTLERAFLRNEGKYESRRRLLYSLKLAAMDQHPVSYTHLTLPTILLV